MKRTEDNLRDLLDNTKRTNIRIIGVPEQEEEKKGSEKIFEEITVENFPNMGKEIVTLGASLVAQWLRICLLMQGTRVRALVWEDPTCHGAAGPVSHNC